MVRILYSISENEIGINVSQVSIMQNDSFNKEDLATDLIRDLIKEKRAERRWKNIRFFLGFLVVVFIIFSMVAPNRQSLMVHEEGSGYVALIRLDGIIGPGQDFSSEQVVPLLHEAFSDQHAKGIVLDINSGGGTPVQASIIHDAIVELKKKYHKKVVVVGEDLLASGAYYVAVAADKIYVNPNTLTGSIGVIVKGFGFTDLIKKIGVERRVFTAGVNKDRLDPFLPVNKDDIEKYKQVIKEVHDNFVGVVLEGRQGKLHADRSLLFSGDFWSGPSALKLGLVDALGGLSEVLHTEFHAEHYKDYTLSQPLLRLLAGQMGTTLSAVLGIEQKGIWEKI